MNGGETRVEHYRIIIIRSVFDKNGFLDKKIASLDRKIIRSSQQILQGTGQDNTDLANSSTLSPRGRAAHSIAHRERSLTRDRLLLFTLVVIEVQITKVNDVIILILKADFLTQTPENRIMKAAARVFVAA